MRFTALRNGLARDQERMTGGTDALSSSVEQRVGGVARIGPANDLSAFADAFGQLNCVGNRLLEHRMQKLDDEFPRRCIVIVKDHMEVAGLGGNVGHEIV